MSTRTLPRWDAGPYSADLGDADVLVSLRTIPERLRAYAEGYTPAQMASSYAPGKWTAAELFLHLAQCEAVFGLRVRMALSEACYVVQPFDQDDWLRRERGVDGQVAFWAYYAQRHLNLVLFSRLTDADREKTLVHPEVGTMHIEWILETLAGHERHHVPHFETIAGL